MMDLKNSLAILFFIVVGFPVFPQTEQNIVLEESVIHLKTFGEGAPILIINGGPGMSSEGFIPLAEVIGKSNKAIIYDQRGTGKSTLNSIDKSSISMDLMLDDIERIRKYLKIDDWVVFGHSFGGMLASYYASKYPKHVRGLILSSSGGLDLDLLSDLNITSRLTKAQQKAFREWNTRIVDGDTSYYARLQRGKALAPAYLFDKSHVPAIAHRLTQGNADVNGLVWQHMQDISFDCKTALKKFSNPVLIIQGRHDIIDKRISKKADALFKDSELVLLDKAAHYGWLEQPDLYFKTIHRFLKDLKG